MTLLRVSRISVKNYKNLSFANVFTKDLTAIVGTNNSGKSNFLEVFNILLLLLHKGEEGRENLARRLSRAHLGELKEPRMSIEIDLEVEVGPKSLGLCSYQIDIELGKDRKIFISHESFLFKESGKAGPYKKLFMRKGVEIEIRNDSKKSRDISPSQSGIEHIKSIFPDAKDLPDSDLKYVSAIVLLSKTKVFKVHGSNNYKDSIRETYPILNVLEEKGDKKYDLFVDALKEILGLDRFVVHKFTAELGGSNKELFYALTSFKDRSGLLSFEDLSDGSQVIYLMLYNIFIKPSPVIVIDEPEIGLHPQAIKTFLDLFLKHQIDKQIIFATHSPFILNIISPELVYVSERNKEGLFCIKSASEFDDFKKALSSKYVQFGDLFADNFTLNYNTSLD